MCCQKPLLYSNLTIGHFSGELKVGIYQGMIGCWGEAFFYFLICKYNENSNFEEILFKKIHKSINYIKIYLYYTLWLNYIQKIVSISRFYDHVKINASGIFCVIRVYYVFIYIYIWYDV